MTKEQLILRAKELVNTTDIKGMTAITLKNAANTDLKLFEEYLREISEQAWDPNSRTETIKAYGKELVDVSMKLFSKPTNYNYINLDEQKIKGGKADNLSIDDIANKFNIDVAKIKRELNMGIKVELEHTKNKDTAKDIAMDHLTEIPDYYTRLKKMEKDGSKKWANESTILIKKLLNEGLKYNAASTLLLDFGFLISNNFSQITRMGKDATATKELSLMMQNLRKPIINGQTYFEIINDVNSIIRNPKMLSAVLGKIREFLIYIEPRVQKFVIDNQFKKHWLEKINELKTLYRNVI